MKNAKRPNERTLPDKIKGKSKKAKVKRQKIKGKSKKAKVKRQK